MAEARDYIHFCVESKHTLYIFYEIMHYRVLTAKYTYIGLVFVQLHRIRTRFLFTFQCFSVLCKKNIGFKI